jgi:anaerobic magnesium-protoporphyrin IX monomethyl ester cyclase
MKVCLATIHVKPAFIPLALLYLKASLVKHGQQPSDVTILEFPPDAESDEIADRIVDAQPDVIGFSVYVWNVTRLLAASRRIKQRRPATRIVLGGPEVGPVAAAVLRAHPYVDVVVKSEGEAPFTAIIAQIERGATLERVPGICFLHDGVVVDTGDAPILQDLNTLPSPHALRYVEPRGRVICIETQRGCVFRCNFCFYNKDLSIRNRRFDLDRVKQELLFWLQQDVAEIYMMDPVFNLNAARTKEICRFIIEHNRRNVPFHAEVWAEFVDEELARLLKEANFHFLEVGLQTTDESALATVERRLKLQPFMEGVGHLKKFNLNFEVQLIYGLPGEDIPSFKRSLNFASALDPSCLAVFPLMVLPGTELWNKASVLQLRFDADPPYFIRSHPSMNEEDIRYGWRVVDAVNHLGASRTARVLSKEENVTFADLVDEWIDWRATSDGPIDAFVTHFCGKRGIPEEFYRASASLEMKRATSYAGS